MQLHRDRRRPGRGLLQRRVRGARLDRRGDGVGVPLRAPAVRLGVSYGEAADGSERLRRACRAGRRRRRGRETGPFGGWLNTSMPVICEPGFDSVVLFAGLK